MTKKLLALCLILGVACAAPDAAPAPLLLRSNDLARTRALVKAKDPGALAALKKLRREAEKALAAPPFVVTEKKHPQSGFDPHDYVSLATYYWPDPTKTNGLPYINRDGERNPETQAEKLPVKDDDKLWSNFYSPSTKK